MKGGFNNPPNRPHADHGPVGHGASMKGGFNNPPNIVETRLGALAMALQ